MLYKIEAWLDDMTFPEPPCLLLSNRDWYTTRQKMKGIDVLLRYHDDARKKQKKSWRIYMTLLNIDFRGLSLYNKNRATTLWWSVDKVVVITEESLWLLRVLSYKPACPLCHKVMSFMEQNNMSFLTRYRCWWRARERLIEVTAGRRVPSLTGRAYMSQWHASGSSFTGFMTMTALQQLPCYRRRLPSLIVPYYRTFLAYIYFQRRQRFCWNINCLLVFMRLRRIRWWQ